MTLIKSFFCFSVFKEGGVADVRAAAAAEPDEPQEVHHGRARLASGDAQGGGKITLSLRTPIGDLFG